MQRMLARNMRVGFDRADEEAIGVAGEGGGCGAGV